jgi:hypothetical protein
MDGMAKPFRIEPVLPVGAVQSYEIKSPVIGVRQLTCEQAQCDGFVNGWKTRLAVDDQRAQYVREGSGRRYIETRDGSMVTFHFPPGQMCFRASEHREFTHAPDAYQLRPGDWRGTAGEVRRFTGRRAADDWVDSFANHQIKIKELHQRG